MDMSFWFVHDVPDHVGPFPESRRFKPAEETVTHGEIVTDQERPTRPLGRWIP